MIPDQEVLNMYQVFELPLLHSVLHVSIVRFFFYLAKATQSDRRAVEQNKTDTCETRLFSESKNFLPLEAVPAQLRMKLHTSVAFFISLK